MAESLRIAIAGLGTVGTGVVKILQQHHDLIAARAGRPVEIVAVSARDRNKDRGVDLSSYEWVDDAVSFAGDKQIDAVIELIGGAEGTAQSLAGQSLTAGKAVVTANKAMLAHHGAALAALSEKHGAPLFYEAAVAGSIPIVKALREGYAANEVAAVYGILNGTCNYILTRMEEEGAPFDEVLDAAQSAGYAEADPSFDIDGIDAAHKLCLLTALAFGVKPDFDKLDVSGIRHITADDVFYAAELGYRIRLLGAARRMDGKIRQSVAPCLVPYDSEMAAVSGVFNAVYVENDFAGHGMLTGRGAGEGPTASAVVADIIDLCRYKNGMAPPVFGVPCTALKQADWMSAGDVTGRFYLHLVVLDCPGVMADISAIMRDHNVSMETVLQKSHDPQNPVSIILTTHPVARSEMEKAVEKINRIKAVAGDVTLMRIERFE